LERQLKRRPPTQAHGAEDGEHPPSIGLDLDELHPAGVPIRVGVALREVDADVSGRPVSARLRPVGGGWRAKVQLSWDAAQGGFEGELLGQAPGLYEIRVSAREVPCAADLVVTDTVAVVEGD
ncbi:MAG: hypothetical protein M3R63_16805, partial [Actinomycetota bacterium]|nr:hypothetical protein [Actinomycetota bacterium]